MRIKIAMLLAFLSAAFLSQGQTDWSRFDHLMADGSYKSAYAMAEGVYNKCKTESGKSGEALLAAYNMTQAAANYQEDVRDSAEARYRSLLPLLAPLEKALCHAFLGEYDSALAYSEVLQATPVEKIKHFCDGGRGENMTPTAYDVVVVQMQGNYQLKPQRRVELQQMLVAFHAQDKDDGLRIWHDLRLLDIMSEVPNRHIDLPTIQSYINKYRGTASRRITGFYYKVAELCNRQGDYVQAVRYCDTAISLFPKSEGGVECAGLRADILAKRVWLEGQGLTVMPGVASPQRVRYRNLTQLWFRVVPYIENYRWDSRSKAQMLRAKSIEEWSLTLVCNDSHRYEEAYFAMPALKAGRYLLMVSPSEDFRKEGFMAYEVHCTDMVHVGLGNGNDLLVDRRSGKPIVGQEVRLEHQPGNSNLRKVLSTTHTDAEGRFRFDYSGVQRWSDYLVIERDGYRLLKNYYSNRASDYTDSNLQCELRVDRPIYRPGDTVHAAALAYHSDGRDGMVATGCRLRLVLSDPNGQQVAEDSVLTDDYGVAATAFVLPTDRIAGQYALWIYNGQRRVCAEWLRVEEYKQPRFMVSVNLAEGQGAPAFGKECTVQGMATAYSGVPVGGARVQYKVSRSRLHYWGWRNWNYEYDPQVTEGEVTAAADGSFSISFVPEVDSTVELDSSTAFRYTVHVDVTDLNGESHEASTSMRVGFRNTFIGLEQDALEYRELPRLDLHLRDINDRPLQGSMHVKVERLQRPTQPLLVHDAMVAYKVHHTMSKEEWRRLFPLYAYDTSDVLSSSWPVAQTVVEGEWKVDGDERIDLPQLISGYYRITATTQGAEPLEHTLCLTRKDARRVQSGRLLWHDLDKRRAEVGERVTLQFGSAFTGTQIYYMLRVGKEDRVFRRVDCRDDAIHTEYIDVDSSMLGGFQVELFTVREGIVEQWNETIEVPFSHKELKVAISTFRDKLLPGEQEEWTIKVGGRKSEVGSSDLIPQTSALILTMYDDALNSYGGSGWGFWPWRHNSSARMDYDRIGDNGYPADWLVQATRPGYSGTYPIVWTLVEALPYYNRWRGRLMYKTAAARNAPEVTTEFEVVEDVAVVEESATARGESGMVTMQGNVRKRSVNSDEAEEMVIQTAQEEPVAVGGVGYSDGGAQPEVQVRTNLNTLAFFAADVRTDSTGTATYRFTVPELLTRWNVRGLAVTKDLKSGTLDRTLVTSKPLMVQPNMPRFLRSGDSLSLMAKVVVAEPKSAPVPVEVAFLLTDAATGDTLCHHTEHVLVKDAAQVMFDVEVPQGVYVATYKIVARADGMSDGEQGQVPVVTNRQAVTVSQALYINGAGEKHFEMPQWLDAGTTREPLLVAAEVVSNPIWLAVKSMPYLSNLENPSTLYLATQLHINTLGKSILDKLNIADVLDKLNENPDSRLRMNEDVKQTLLQATPWVRDALAEEDQMATVKNYFDHERMEAQLSDLGKQLSERQNADGGWCWMPDGKSSLWVTQQVLQNLKLESGNLKVESEKALKYIDREQQAHYDRYIKPYLKKGYKWEPTDIDYLYTRSFYGKANTEAYKYYYSNALKHYRNCENLYTQVQLALVFFRHGDRKEALDLLRRIKEKALVNDEMGMYWRDNRSSWWWYQRPIETQALLVLAFSEITPDDRETIGLMQQWLLKQKQTTHWGNDCATAHAIEALTLGTRRAASASHWQLTADSPQPATSLTVFGQPVSASATGLEGYRQQRWTGASLDSLRSHACSDIIIRKSDSAIAWGAVYYQFADEMDKIPSTDMGITIKRAYLHDGPLHVGDRVRVRIDIQCDRTMEYLELIDGRPSCVEPLSTQAGWRWSDGLSYYITVNQTDTRCYIDRLEKGRYWFEYEVYVTNPGRFMAGPVTIQCMYAPEFRAIDKAVIMEVKQ